MTFNSDKPSDAQIWAVTTLELKLTCSTGLKPFFLAAKGCVELPIALVFGLLLMLLESWRAGLFYPTQGLCCRSGSSPLASW